MDGKILILICFIAIGCQQQKENCFYSFNEKIDKNSIKELISNPACQPVADKIKKLDLSNQSLENLSFLKKLPNIESLNLRNNVISKIDPIKKLSKLKYLDLRNNLIEDISGLKGNKNLEQVFLQGNLIQSKKANCPTDFNLRSLNNYCLRLSYLKNLRINLSKISNDSCSQENPVNLLIQKKWGGIDLLKKRNGIMNEKRFGSWSEFMRQMPLYDQGQTGLCYAYAAIQLIDYWRETNNFKITKRMAHSSPLYGAFLLKSLDKGESKNSLDYGYSEKVIQYVKKNGMCRSDVIDDSLKKFTFGKNVKEIDFYKTLEAFFKKKEDLKKEELLNLAKRVDLEGYANLSLSSRSLVQAFETVFSECQKPTSIYINSKKIPKPKVIRVVNAERKKIIKKLIRLLLNKKKAQPIGVTYCSHFLNNDKNYRGVIIKNKKAYIDNIKKCKMHASILVGKKRKCNDNVLKAIIKNYMVEGFNLSKFDFDEIISEMYILLSNNQGNIDSDTIGRELLKQIKRSNFIWDKKINWKKVKKILKSEHYRDPASMELNGLLVIRNLCKLKNSCEDPIIRNEINQYKNKESVISQKDFVDKFKNILTVIYPSLELEEVESVIEDSMNWTKKVNWERLKEDMMPFLKIGGLGKFKKQIYAKCETKGAGGCYYLLRNTWSRGIENKECSATNWECRYDGYGQSVGTWIHEEALINNLHKVFYLDNDLN